MIGVFDSGHGGLTVLRALADQMPDRRFVYLGDHANAPYGNRTPEEIYRYTVAGVERLFGLGCPLVILACNTASAQALRRLQQTWLPAAYPERRVLGVLVPMVEAITGVPWMADVAAGSRAGEPRTVAIFATQHTVSSGAYPTEIAKRAPEVRVVQQACPDLVRLIEADAPVETIRAAIEGYAGQLMAQLDGVPPDAVVLGCTHYPLVADLFAQALPPGVEILDQPDLTVSSLRAYLERHPEYELPSRAREQGGVEAFHTTGPAEPITRLASRFFGGEARFHSVGPDPIPESLRG
ncbi:glutamate racemase [Nitrospirillum amazonense]|uniref:Glutamate racemase n=1 Tax=Nitrospirillum amazonense TaxID=28077 RepID=A0A560JWN2_9PROT|nr:glutamate racemase [Nitrospirillum amazonense]MDG3440547.1 glutamate racemase [Nitrospirillum amazonense]TWB75119.1 glutamate racemase [Nitrospirillum amazonense]